MYYNLQPNEGVLLQSIHVMRVGGSDSCDELILTNKNIIYVDRAQNSMAVKNVLYFPINKVKRVNDQPQVTLGLNGVNGKPQLQVFFNESMESFEFLKHSKSEINKWIKAIIAAIEEDDYEGNPKAIKGVKWVTESIRDTIGVIKSTFSDQPKKEPNTATKCIGCRAPLSGKRNTVVTCKYCNTSQKLK